MFHLPLELFREVLSVKTLPLHGYFNRRPPVAEETEIQVSEETYFARLLYKASYLNMTE